SDRKLLKEIAPVALERLCRCTLADIDRIASDGTRSCHQRCHFRFHKRRDPEIAEAFDDLRRSTALFWLSAICVHGLLRDEELLRFSDETRTAIVPHP